MAYSRLFAWIAYFYPRSPCGERRAFFMPLILSYEISIHALLAESDNAHLYYHSRGLNISIHALLAESDTGTLNPKKYDRTFLSTLSLRRATFSYFLHIHRPLFLSTLSLRRATTEVGGSNQTIINFYPRSPCGERRCITRSFGQSIPFLSTLSLRRATAPNRRPCSRSKNFYPRSPCGERLGCRIYDMSAA